MAAKSLTVNKAVCPKCGVKNAIVALGDNITCKKCRCEFCVVVPSKHK